MSKYLREGDKRLLEVRESLIGRKHRVEITEAITRASTSLEGAQAGLEMLGEIKDRGERAKEEERHQARVEETYGQLQAELKRQGCPDNLSFANKVHLAYQNQVVGAMRSFYR